MNSLESKIAAVTTQIENGLIVSCQAPAGSPLAKPEIIAAFAKTAELNGAVAVRIDSPPHIAAARESVRNPIFGIYKIVCPESEVYITPTFDAAKKIAAAGADVIAVDATPRSRPRGEKLCDLCGEIRENLRLPVMADVSTFDEGVRAAEEIGCDFVSTTLSGYTKQTGHLLAEPDFALVEKLARWLSVPIIAEGRLKSSADVRKALECGAFAVVVGNAITGIDSLVGQFVDACKRQSGTSLH